MEGGPTRRANNGPDLTTTIAQTTEMAEEMKASKNLIPYETAHFDGGDGGW